MKILFTADIHLQNWNDKKHDSSGNPLKLIEIINTLKQMASYYREHNLDLFVIGGDLGHLRGIIHARSFLLFKDFIEENPDIQFRIIHGNHDITSRSDNDDTSVISLFDSHVNVKTYINPEVDDIITYLPWSNDITKKLHEVLPNKILISHVALSEASTSSGLSIRTGVSLKDFSKFDLVLLGDYHKPQMLEINNTKVYYSGSPIQLTRGEAGEEKRFLVIDSDTLEVKSIPTEGYRKYICLDYTKETDVNSFKDNLEQLSVTDDYLVVKTDIKDIPKEIKDIINENTIKLVDQSEDDYEIRGITSSMNITDQCLKWLEIKKIPSVERYMGVLSEIDM